MACSALSAARSAVLLLGLGLLGQGCAPAARCGEAAACDDDERCEAGACVAEEANGAVRVTRLSASPAAITAGEATTLAWATQNAAACSLAPSVGPVPRSGTVELHPAATTTWTLTCDGRAGPASAEVTVRVEPSGEVPDGGDGDGGDGEHGDGDGGEHEHEDGDGGSSEGGFPDEPDAGPDDPGVIVSGSVALLPSPPAALSAAVGDEGAILFRERAGVVLDEWVHADVAFPASYGAGEDLSHTEPRVQLVPGNVLDSWLLHVEDPTATPLEGALTFAREVVAVSFQEPTLNDSDGPFAAPGIAYPLEGPRQWSLASTDSFTLSGDRRTLTFFRAAGTSAAQLRVLVDASEGVRPLLQTWTLNVHRQGALDLRSDAYEPPGHGLVLDEGTHTLAANVALDADAPGRYAQTGQLPGGSLVAGSTVQSWLLHFDPSAVDIEAGMTTFVGAVTFPKRIVGLVMTSAKLTGSDAAFARDDVQYPVTYNFRGVELSLGDEVWWSADGKSVRLSLAMTAGGAGLDQIRVITLP